MLVLTWNEDRGCRERLELQEVVATETGAGGDQWLPMENGTPAVVCGRPVVVCGRPVVVCGRKAIEFGRLVVSIGLSSGGRDAAKRDKPADVQVGTPTVGMVALKPVVDGMVPPHVVPNGKPAVCSG